MFQFYDANRSGRWAGRLIQLQNLPQNHMKDLAEVREIVKSGDYDTMELLYEDIPDALSQLIRTAFVARYGYKFIVSDFSAIEARVLAFLAGEKWRSKVFAEGKDIYCASAMTMLVVRMVIFMFMEYNTRHIPRNTGTMHIPVMASISAHNCDIILVRHDDAEVLRIQTFQVLRIKHWQPPPLRHRQPVFLRQVSPSVPSFPSGTSAEASSFPLP